MGRRLFAFALFVVALLVPSLAAAAETRLAIVVGNNGSGSLGRAELRYADDDAAKYAALFTAASDEGDVELLARFDGDTSRLFPEQQKKAAPPTRAALDGAVSRIVARAQAAQRRGDRVVFTFVFAGHGDVEDGRGFLELEDGRFFREDLEAMIARIPAARAHVLLDACNSVYMLVSRKPGGTKFTTPDEVERSMAARLAHVGTFVSTSADAQVYEWSRIESGVFSHSVRSGLAGAADLDGDGRITYGELRAFVRIAAEGVPNARFRPRLYARGPGGRDDEVIFEPRAVGVGRKVPLAAGAERRVTVLDANEVPLVDVKLEGGFGTSLYLAGIGAPVVSRSLTVVEREEGRPEQRTELAFGSNGELVARAEAPPRLASRAAGRPFELLFARPFGPRAVAALPAERAEEDVYGVSNEDRDRMKRLLAAAAQNSRDQRVNEGSASLALAATAFGIGTAAWVTSSSADARTTKDIVGGVFMGIGTIGLLSSSQLLIPSTMEKRQRAFVASLGGRPEAVDLAVRNAEQELYTRETDARMQRFTEAGLLFGFGALEMGGGLALALTADDASLKWLGGGLLATGLGTGVTGIGRLAVRSEEERIAELWRNERAIAPARAQSSIKVRPQVGPTGIGLAGTF